MLGNYIPKKFLPCFSLIYSAEQRFADDFAKSLSQFDELLLLDIYPVNYQRNYVMVMGKVDHKIRS
jgi:UDP-N-acetylmuramate-alanine ligase